VEKELKEKQEESSELLQYLQKVLEQYIKDVRLTNRLTSSPVCLVGTEMDYSPQLERLLQMGEGGTSKQRRIMELNPQHEIFLKMQERFGKDKDDGRWPIMPSCSSVMLFSRRARSCPTRLSSTDWLPD